MSRLRRLLERTSEIPARASVLLSRARNAGDRHWGLVWGALLIGVAVVFPLVFWNIFGGAKEIFAYAGTVLTVLVGLIAHTLTRQSNQQLKLDAAMRAGGLFSTKENAPVDPAVAASGLMALTRLNQAELAVALLVDLWPEATKRVSDETAILVIDAALRQTKQPNARLVAAELLCRNAHRLNACQSLHWPSILDGRWDPSFGERTKLLLIEALLEMTLATQPSENALRSVAVRLYGIWERDPILRRGGCVATLLGAIVPTLQGFNYTDFMQGDQRVLLPQLEKAVATAHTDPDWFLDRLVTHKANDLKAWAARCDKILDFRGCLAATVQQPS